MENMVSAYFGNIASGIMPFNGRNGGEKNGEKKAG